ncbi:MAG: hypothetical protein HOV79_00495 [Hamadaea sp.]|nr:hypothetical protein [Hamadaea sp.]
MDWNGDEISELLHGTSAEGLGLAVEFLLHEARVEVPIEEGTLERSGAASVDEDSLTGAVSFDTVYAVPQHERLDYRHAEGRKAKYLEDPMNRNRATLLELIALPSQEALS